MGVDLRRVNPELLLGNLDYDGERLVDLKMRNVVDLEAGSLQSDRDCVGGGLREVDRVNTGIGVRWVVRVSKEIYKSGTGEEN